MERDAIGEENKKKNGEKKFFFKNRLFFENLYIEMKEIV